MDPIGFLSPSFAYDENKRVGKAIFNIKTNYPKIDVNIQDSSYHISLLINDGERTVFDHELSGHFDWGNIGTAINLVPEYPYTADLTKYIKNGYLSFYQAECYGHLNTWSGSDIYIILGSYYFQYKTWKTCDTDYGWKFVTKGKYYEGLVPNLLS